MKPPGSLARSRPLRRQSPRRAGQRKARRECVRIVAERCQGRCEAKVPQVCTGDAMDPHEILTRARRGSITDPANVLAVCRNCHIWIGNNQSEALAAGLLASGCGREA